MVDDKSEIDSRTKMMKNTIKDNPSLTSFEIILSFVSIDNLFNSPIEI